MNVEQVVKLVLVSSVCVLAGDWAISQPFVASKGRWVQLGAKYGAGAAVMLAASKAGILTVAVRAAG